MTLVPSLVLMVALLVLSAFFSGSETALFNLRREDLRLLGHGRGLFVRRLLKDPRSLLITVLLSNLVVNTLFYGTAVVLSLKLGRQGHGHLAAAVGVAAPLLVILLGEVTPKTIAVRSPRPIAEFAAPLLTLLRTFLWPVRAVLGAVTEGALRLLVPRRTVEPYVTADELKQLLGMSQSRGTVRPEEGRMLRDLVDLGRLRVREVMVPRVDVVMCSIAESTAAFIDLVNATGRQHIPVYSVSPDHIVGVVDARMVLAHQPPSLIECLRPVRYVPETKSVESLLREFRETHTARAIVVDEYGGTAGLVTLEDIVEELVGAIGPAETPAGEGPLRSVHTLDERTYRVPGRLPIRDWNEHPAFIDLTERRADTIGGFLLSLFGRLPREGESITHRNLRFTVGPVVRRRIQSVTVEVLSTEPSAKTGTRGGSGPGR